jgi:predicted Zn-dependent peptidase
MNRLAKMEIYLQQYYDLDETLNAIEKVKQEDVMNTANELFGSNRIFTTILKPTEQS